MNGLYPRLEYDHSISLLTYTHTRKDIVVTSCHKQDRLQPIQEKKTTRVYTYTYIYIHIYMCICYLFFIIMCIVAKKMWIFIVDYCLKKEVPANVSSM